MAEVWVDYLLRNASAYASFIEDLEKMQEKALREMADAIESDLNAALSAKARFTAFKSLMNKLELEKREEESNADFREKKK